jgi:hypothetical protein
MGAEVVVEMEEAEVGVEMAAGIMAAGIMAAGMGTEGITTTEGIITTADTIIIPAWVSTG